MPDYRTALDETQSAIGRRAKNFRNQVVAVVVAGLTSFAWALIARSWVPLVALVILFPIVGGFFFADARLLEGWRSSLLARWTSREIDFFAFRSAIRSHPALPKGTLEAMLATLPDSGSLTNEQTLTTASREAIAAETRAKYRARSNHLAAKATASALVAVAIIAAAAIRRWEPLAALAAVPLLLLAARPRRSIR